jgi:hypothetical protein
MESKPVSNRMYSILVLFDMQSTFFSSAIDGISDKDAHNRLNTKANHIAWLTGSLVQQRYDLAEGLKVSPAILQKRSAAPELFSNHKGIQDNVSYPSLTEFSKDWQQITPVLRDALLRATDAQLDAPYEMPDMKMTYFDLLSFSIYREANCIGQIALWRRLLGYEAMKYM